MTTATTGRHIPDRLTSPAARALKSWEALLLGLAVAIFILNALASPYFLDPWNLSDASFNFTEKAMIALAMVMLIVAGEIDLSVGASTPVLVLLGLGTGLLCGVFNGVLVARFGLPSIVVTIGTMSLFRGISYIMLGDGAFTGYPQAFSWFGQDYVFWVITVELVIFALAAAIFGVLLHRTSFGRMVYAIGNNATAARFSGIRVDRIRFILFPLTELMSGIAAICLTSRLGSTRPSIASGFELEAVTIVVLGGVSILGGSGSILGVVLAAFEMGLVTFGLGLLNVPGIVMSIIVCALLIGVIAVPRLWTMARGR